MTRQLGRRTLQRHCRATWESFFSLHRRSNAGLAAATRCPVPATYIEQMIDGSTCKDGGVFSPFRDRAHSARGRDGQTGELDRPRDGRALLPLAAHQVTGLRGHTWLMAPSLSLCCGCHASCMYALLFFFKEITLLYIESN